MTAHAARIVLDARMVGMGGIGRYVESLAGEMLRQRPDWDWTFVGDPDRLCRFRSFGARVRPSRARIYSLEEAFGLGALFRDADVAHMPHFNAPLFFPKKPRLVVTVHDLIHFDYPEYQPFPGANGALDWKLRRLLKRADGIVAVSRATASAIAARYPRATESGSKIRVIPEAAEAIFSSVPQPDDAERLGRKGIAAQDRYVLYVGAIREHKETHVLAEAFAAFVGKNPSERLRLVLAGKLDGRYDRKRNFAAEVLGRPDVLHISDAVDADLAALYRRAAVVVLPSRIEGFGLPVVEALESGAPLIVSDIPVLREVAGEAAMTFRPGDAADLRNRLSEALSASRPHPVRRPFAWKDAARQTLELYDQLLRSSR